MESHCQKKVAIAGAGGNIGSQLIPLIGRMASIGQVTLIDPGNYEEKNLTSQNIDRNDIGRPKVRVQQERLSQINPCLAVNVFARRVEETPWGELRADVIIACLDTRRARMAVNEAAWRLGVPWIDAGVDGRALLARAEVYRSGDDTPCLECGWDAADYDAVEESYPCQPGDSAASMPTNAPTTVGALAAVCQAVECRKLLGGETSQALIGRQVMIDLRHHKHYVTRFRKNTCCRFDHKTWHIDRLEGGPQAWTLSRVFRSLRESPDEDHAGEDRPALRVPGDTFVRRMTCPACLKSRTLLRLRGRLSNAERNCNRCGGPMSIAGFDGCEWLAEPAVSATESARSLADLGFQARDVFSVRRGTRTMHFELEEDD